MGLEHKQIKDYLKKSYKSCPSAYALYLLAKFYKDRGNYKND